MTIALDEFAQELQRPITEPERLALAIAHIAYPQLETEYYLHELDQLAKIMEKRLAVNEESKHQAHRFLRIFCQELGFTGDREHYYHPDNSYLNVVLERRRGLPITLCLICVAIARRIHLQRRGHEWRIRVGAYFWDSTHVECGKLSCDYTRSMGAAYSLQSAQHLPWQPRYTHDHSSA